jgi:hypothetical protein
MTPASEGRHCAACAKTVIDFTQKTDAEILAYFRQVGAGRTCGRFQAGQLERPLRPAKPMVRPPYWQLWLAGLLAAALSAQSCQSTTGEVQPATARHLVPPSLTMPAIDSAAIGDTQALTGDSVVVSAAPASSGQLVNSVLGAPEVQ